MSSRQAVVGLCAVFDVGTSDLDDGQIEIIAVRIVAELGDRPTAVGVGKIVDEVRFSERAAGAEPSSVEPAPAALDIPLGQRAMDAAVAVFDEVAERRKTRPGAVHPACLSSWADHGTACSRCTYSLCDSDECTHQECNWDRWFEAES